MTVHTTLSAAVLAGAAMLCVVRETAGQTVLNVGTTRSCIIDYEVRDGFVIPKFGRVTSGVVFGAEGPRQERAGDRTRYDRRGIPVPPDIERPDTRAAVARFLEQYAQEKQTAAAPAEAPSETPGATRTARALPSTAPRTTTQVGLVRRAADGSLTFTPDPPADTKTYRLTNEAPVAALAEASALMNLRVVVIGRIGFAADPDLLQVQSAWMAPGGPSPATPDAPAAD